MIRRLRQTETAAACFLSLLFLSVRKNSKREGKWAHERMQTGVMKKPGRLAIPKVCREMLDGTGVWFYNESAL